ncbi:indole-3-glycerol phosphate synthase [Thermosporothrix hazakensis]|jgi:indole-3-glycerol phosphate synthase/phosphoribosylanthranilate isomerase/anthranilate synthase/indole-3-glycerol phosphate synthase/phosphoribosylanthranilate isomerase|uniref:Multifunctional fusion protein n=1 Tax=Thermosporothrix hazakensis TaxID=644383 RepID=A0A326UC23_THEHA|nr:bifunctional indole-3-glycerol-phosphate synthase TrpC/phosphoribosylanthranilate isomerase TrpF [Thermosporothrix hazakensis]PZW36047.1 indole-3-glycerol phosphate synthase [Thermosporothrix hazakensis]GCE46700.1 bifunctional indole-3-glycerol phosphate synthase/phosphoribosylanthranilate isomerase [Thermosporothrix hazakensis]
MFLDRIVAQTREDLILRKQDCSLEEMRARALAQPAPRDMLAAFTPRTRVNLIAEVKRASPSKGLLAPDLDPVALAKVYEANGAAAISVLTEPHFFLGAPEFLTAIKQAVQVPVLRKDFIVDEYQVYEARAWGADAILLICALLDDAQLRYLLELARSLGMCSLVEAHTTEEVRRAVAADAKLIGVNSRDLVTFKMNPYLIRDMRRFIPADRVVVAESGIHTADDARRVARYDVQAMLVGESLVVSGDVPTQMRTLLQGANEGMQVKVCGLKRAEDVEVAIEAGADFLGLIFYKPSHRYVAPERVRSLLEATAGYVSYVNGKPAPDLVGVFVNEDAEVINEIAEQAGLHFVQLHGTESPEFCQRIQRPVLKALHLNDQTDLALMDAYHDVAWRLLLDTPAPQQWGGTGVPHDWALAAKAAQRQRVFLAGGLTPENVQEALSQVRPWGVDVSSGVETERRKDPAKIRAFLQQVRSHSLPVVTL